MQHSPPPPLPATVFADNVTLFVSTAPWVTLPVPLAAPRQHKRRGTSGADHRTAVAEYDAAQHRNARAVSDFLVPLCGQDDTAAAAAQATGFFAFVIYYASFLTFWSSKQQQQQQQRPGQVQELGADAVSTFDEYLASVYGVEAGATARNATGHGGGSRGGGRVREVLQAAMPLLPPAEECLWRQPALVASFGTLASGLTYLQDHNHAPCRWGRGKGRHHRRRRRGRGGEEEVEREVMVCPVCVAAALDDALAAEACWCLLALHTTLHTENSRRRTASAGERSPLLIHAIAACRVALVNGATVTPTSWCRLWLTAPCRHSLFRDGLPVAARRRTLLLSVANLVAQDMAALSACSGASRGEEEEDYLARDESDVAATLYAMYCFTVHSAEETAEGEEAFVALTVHTPFPWLTTTVAPPQQQQQGEAGDDDDDDVGAGRGGGATLLSWVCAAGYLQAARCILQVVLTRRDRQHVRTVEPSLTAPLNAALSSGSEASWTTKAALARLLLLAGASVHCLHPAVTTYLCTKEGEESSDDTVRRQLVHLLCRPGLVLDPPVGVSEQITASNSNSSSGGGGQLLERLQLSATASSAGDRLAQLALRLWSEKVRHLSTSTANSTASSDQSRLVRAAQDRVLRLTLAALSFDPYQPTARLVLIAVLGRRLLDAHAAAHSPTTTATTTRRGAEEGKEDGEAGRYAAALLLLTELHVYAEAAEGLAEQVGRECGFLTRAVRSQLVLLHAVTEDERLDREGSRRERSDDNDYDEKDKATADPKLRTETMAEDLQRLLDTVERDGAALADIAARGELWQRLSVHQAARGEQGSPPTVPSGAPLMAIVQPTANLRVPPVYLRIAIPGKHRSHVWVRAASEILDVAATLKAAATARQQPPLPHEEEEGAVVGCVGLVDSETPPHAPVCRGDLLVFRGTGASEAPGACYGFSGFEAVRIISPPPATGTQRSLANGREGPLFRRACQVKVRCVCRSGGGELERGLLSSSSSSSYSTNSNSSSDSDAAAGNGTHVGDRLRTVQLQCLLAPFNAGGRWEGGGGGGGEEPATTVVHPLQWLEVRPTPSAHGAESATDVVAALSARPDLTRALHAVLAVAASHSSQPPCWAAKRSTSLPSESGQTGTEGADTFVTGRSTCLWHLPTTLAAHCCRCHPAFPSSPSPHEDEELLVGPDALGVATVRGVFPRSFGF